MTIGILYLRPDFIRGDGFDPIIQQIPSYPNDPKVKIISINDYGAIGDGITDDAESLQGAWKAACSSTSPVRIMIPVGTYFIKPSNFYGPCQSKLTLRIYGSIVAPEDPGAWEGLDSHKWLYFDRIDNLTVEGGGLIDGAGQKWWAQTCKANKSDICPHPPTAVIFHQCNNLKVKRLTLVNSPQMHIAFSESIHVSASYIGVLAPEDSPNTDGIHISKSMQVEIKNAMISTGDDCISIVGNSSHIRMQNITCGPGHGISIGSLGKSNSSATIQYVTLDGADLRNTANGVRIKTWQGGSGLVRKISFNNITMQNVSNPIVIDQYYCDSPLPCLNQTSALKIDHISFRGITGTSLKEVAIRFACSDTFSCTNLYLENVQLVPISGTVRSSCWNAYGTISGVVYPPACISCCEPHQLALRRDESDSLNLRLGSMKLSKE